jgi:hypothetical protein
MKFMITGSEPRGEWQRLDAEEMNGRVRVHQRKLEELAAARAATDLPGLVFATIGLGAEHDVVTVKHDGGRHISTDGPFPETKEVIGGFDIVEFASPRAAVEWATATARHASHVSEIRPIAEFWWFSGIVDRVRVMQIEGWPEMPDRRVNAGAQVFLLTSVDDERMTASLPEPDRRRLQRRLAAEYIRERSTMTHETGMWLGARLGPRAETSTVRWGAGKPAVSDGPSARTSAVVTGVSIVACASQDEAVAWARKLAPHAGQSVEVRSVRACWWFYRE